MPLELTSPSVSLQLPEKLPLICYKLSQVILTSLQAKFLKNWRLLCWRISGEHPQHLIGISFPLLLKDQERALLVSKILVAHAIWILSCNNSLWSLTLEIQLFRLTTLKWTKIHLMKTCFTKLASSSALWSLVKDSIMIPDCSAMLSRIMMATPLMFWSRWMSMSSSTIFSISLRTSSKNQRQMELFKEFSEVFSVMNSFVRAALIIVRLKSHI